MPRVSPTLLLLAFASLIAAQGDYQYDSNNYFIFPPTPVASKDFGAAVNITSGQVTFSWVSNLSAISLSIYQEGNTYFPVLIGPYSGSRYTWNGSISELGPNDGQWPGYNPDEAIFFLGIRDAYSVNTKPLFFSRYFKFVHEENTETGAASSTTSTTTSPISSSPAVSTSSGTSVASLTGGPSSSSIGGAAAQSSTSSSDSSRSLVAIGAGVGAGVGVPFLIAMGVIIWFLTRRKSKAAPAAATVPQHQTSMAQPGLSHRQHIDSVHEYTRHDRPVELASTTPTPPTYKST